MAENEFTGKVAVITGAGSGMGRETAKLFAQSGASVVAFDISGAEEDVAKEMGGSAIAVHGSVKEAEDMQSLMNTAVEAFGRLDVLCNVAGVTPASPAPTADHLIDDFDNVIAVNLRGTFLGMKFAIPHMLAAGEGAIVNWGSLASVFGMPYAAGYVASKGGVAQLTKMTAVEYAKQNIRVNAILPGMIDTPIIQKALEAGFADVDPTRAVEMLTARVPQGRFGAPEEVARVALFLSSPAASHVTGVIVPVDGGYVAF